MELDKPQIKGPIAILGWGVSGKGAAALAENIGIEYRVYDEMNRSGGSSDFITDLGSSFSEVVYSPGFRQNHPWIVAAKSAGCRCMSELEFASCFWSHDLIAVTGTNGKTTLTGFLAYALKANGKPALSVGNIGSSFSRAFVKAKSEWKTAICEVSSFQSEGFDQFACDAVLWTNFSEDHLDRHSDMKTYFASKWKLVDSLKSDCLIVGETVKAYADKMGFVLPRNARVVGAEPGPKGSVFEGYPQCENYALAKAYWDSCGYDTSLLEKAAETYKLPKHRLQKVDQLQGVTFWNDSKATNFASAIAAVKAVPKPLCWIGGGKSKGGDIGMFAKQLSEYIDYAFIIGSCADELSGAFSECGQESTICGSIDEAVRMSWTYSAEGGSILLSPGFSSFDQFNSYAERGQCFEDTVASLKNCCEEAGNNLLKDMPEI